MGEEKGERARGGRNVALWRSGRSRAGEGEDGGGWRKRGKVVVVDPLPQVLYRPADGLFPRFPTASRVSLPPTTSYPATPRATLPVKLDASISNWSVIGIMAGMLLRVVIISQDILRPIPGRLSSNQSLARAVS